MALIVLTGAITGGVLILIGYLAVARMFDTAERIISDDLGRSQSRAGMHDTLERIRRTQDRISTSTASGLQAEVARLLDVLEGLIDGARQHLPDQGQGSYADMREQLGALRDVSTNWSERTVRDGREIEEGAELLRGRTSNLRARLDDLRARTGGEPRVPPVAIERFVDEGTALLNEFELAAESEWAPAGTLGESMRKHATRVRAAALEGQGELSGSVERIMLAQQVEQLDGFAQLAVELMQKVVDAGRRSRETRLRRDDLMVQLGAGADTLVVDLQRDLGQRSTELSVDRYNLVTLMGLALSIGLAVLVALVTFFASGLEHDVSELMDVARAMERGESAAPLKMGGATAELSEVARAFSRLAGILAAVREKQTAYNRIVTGLNRNVFLHEILRVSLTELCRATRSKAGCVYLKVTGRDELLLAETYAVPRGASTPDVVRMGEGLVGEVARSGETLLTDDLPRGAMKIVSATVDVDIGSMLLVPIAYKEELMGVLEMAGLQRFEKETVAFVEDVVFQLAVAINNARAIETIRTNQLALQNKTIELEELNAALEHANLLKSEFLATVSHELRTPLNAIIGFSELTLETDRQLSNTARENLRKILRNGENLLALINDILDLSKIEAGKMVVEAHELDPKALVCEVVADFEPAAQRKGIGLSCNVDAGPARIRLDADKLRRIVLNLVSNAVKFTEAGEVAVRLFTTATKLKLEVRDTGIGIEADSLAKVFEKFRQADGSVTRRFGGTGLGLAITKELCHLMGGSVRVFSQAGSGSTFTVTLPLGPTPQTIAVRLPEDSSPADPGQST